MKKTKIFALLLALLMVATMVAACTPTSDTSDTPSGDTSSTTSDTPAVEFDGTEGYVNLDGKVYGEDYTSVYEKYGKDITIADVQKNDDGDCYIEKDGKQYILGLDFLSMAMVYNCGNGTLEEQNSAYTKWWQYYIERWNKMLPEIPLYCNQYYDVYSTKIQQVKENPTNPLWSAAAALIDWTSVKEDNSIILGNSTELSGLFRYSSYGVSNPGAADQDIEGLTVELGTVVANKNGAYVWNPTVVKSHTETVNDDGSKTFEIEIYDDLKFSDGSAVTAKDYLVGTLVFSTKVATAAMGRNKMRGMNVVGYESFAAYDGGEEGTKELSGLRMFGDYKFSVTIDKQYLPYFYDIAYAGFSAQYAKMWLGDAEIKDDGNGCYITDDFYAKEGDEYAMAAHLNATSQNTDTTYPYSGPYYVESYDAASKIATLKVNTYYKGNYEGSKPSIGTVIYKRVVTATQLQDLKSGGVDILMGVTGGDATKEALKLIDESNGAYDDVNYGRAGYGKLGFRCDFGASQFTAVRQAIALCMDRPDFAKKFTSGYGGVVEGPYYSTFWAYAAVKNDIKLDAYATDKDAAIKTLEADGWVYDKDGNTYTEGIRYKKIAASIITEADKTFASADGKYKTEKVGDFYYMPLVINWFGTTDNDFTDLLVGAFQENSNLADCGAYITAKAGDFYPMLAELYQQDYGSGVYGGVPTYAAFNFATGYNSAVYDYAYNNTVDNTMYDMYSQYYIIDEADIIFLK